MRPQVPGVAEDLSAGRALDGRLGVHPSVVSQVLAPTERTSARVAHIPVVLPLPADADSDRLKTHIVVVHGQLLVSKTQEEEAEHESIYLFICLFVYLRI